MSPPDTTAPPPETDGTAAAPKIDRAALGSVYFTIFLDLLGFGIILPWLPFYAAELGATGFGLGFLFTSYSLAQLLGAALLGHLSDRFGRRPLLLLSLAGAALGMILSGLAQTLVALCAARAVAGLFGGSIAIAQAYVADVTRPEDRARYMGFVGASIGLGFVIGPALGALFIALGQGFSQVAFFSAGLALINLVVAARRLREPRHGGGDGLVARRMAATSWRLAFGRGELVRVLVATLLTMSGFVAMETTFAFLGRDRFGLAELKFGLVLTFVGVVMIIVQGGLIGPLTRRFGVGKVAVAGCVLMGLSLAALPLAPGLPLAVAALGALAAAQGLTSPTLSTLTSKLAHENEQGAVLGVAQSLSAAARAFAPLGAGKLYDIVQGSPYFIGGGLAILAGLLLAGLGEDRTGG